MTWHPYKQFTPLTVERPSPTIEYVHVRFADCAEFRFKTKPRYLDTFAIERVEPYVEQTVTRNQTVWSTNGRFTRVERVHPVGKGWRLHGEIADHSIWRRRGRPRGRVHEAMHAMEVAYPPRGRR